MSMWKRDIDPVSKTEEIFFDNGDTLPACFNVDSREIKEGKQIGKGIWTVHEAEWLGRKVAVKKFVAENTFGNVALTSREVNRMLSLRHPNVLKLLGFYLTTQRDLVLDCTMIMELMDCDLEDYIKRGALSDDQVVYIIAEVARGMNHIHQRGCFHRDLKPKNVLLKKSLVTGFHVDVKISDFGSSELVGVGDINRIAGTMGYKAPEQFDSTSKLSPNKADVFGFGALCFKILTGKEPYQSRKNVRETIEQLDRAAFSQRNLPQDVVAMIWKCLNANAGLRPNFEEISQILDGALSAIREKMPRPLAPMNNGSLNSGESMTNVVQGHDRLKSVLPRMGLSEEYGVYFFPFEELVVLQPIALGAFAGLYKVEWKGILYALKLFEREWSLHYSYLGKTFFQNFPKLLHKNIVTFMGYSVTPSEEICILMEMQEMNLAEALHFHTFRGSKQVLDIDKKWRIVKEIAQGMKYLHEHGILHGDLKPLNVVVSALNTNKMIVKLIDFASDTEIFTTRYCAPERLGRCLLRSGKCLDAKKSDVYSFGILCQEILAGVPPFQGMRLPELHEALIRGKRPPIPVGTSPEMEHLIQSCWNVDPQERPDFVDICKKLSRILDYESCQEQHYQQHFAKKCCIL